MYKFWKIILFFFFPFSLFGQSFELLDSIKAPPIIDSLLIDRNKNNWSLRIFTNVKYQQFALTTDDANIQFIPNNPVGIGIGFATSKLSIDIGFNIKGGEDEPTSKFDLRFNFIHKKHLIDYFLQSYKGFNVIYSNSSIENFRPDMHSINTGVNYLFLLNNKQYKVEGIRSFNGYPKKPGIGVGIGTFGIIIKQSADSSIINNLHNSVFELNGFNQFFGIGLGALTGISAFIPFSNNYYASIGVSPGIGLIYKKIQNNHYTFNPANHLLYQIYSGAAVGFIKNKVYISASIGIGYYGTDLNIKTEELINLTKAKLTFGYKIFRK